MLRIRGAGQQLQHSSHAHAGPKKKKSLLCLLLRSLNYRRPSIALELRGFSSQRWRSLWLSPLCSSYMQCQGFSSTGACLRSPLTREDRQWDLWRVDRTEKREGRRKACMVISDCSSRALHLVPAFNSNFRYSTVSACIMHTPWDNGMHCRGGCWLCCGDRLELVPYVTFASAQVPRSILQLLGAECVAMT